MTIETARKDDLPELLDFLYGIFRAGNPDHPRFEALYPDLFVPTDEAAGRHRLIRQDGRIAACVGTYPMTLGLAGCRVPAAALGQVATDPALRGRGCMSRLLADAVAGMERDGAAVSWLSGRQSRYARHGWETVSAGFSFHFGAVGGTAGASDSGPDDAWEVRPAETGDDAVVTDALFAMRASASTVEDAPANYRLRLGRGGRAEVWTARRHGSDAPEAWGVVFPKSRRFVDCCGSPEGVLRLARGVARRHGGVSLATSSADTSLNEALRRECAGMGFPAQMLLVVSLERTLAAYAPLLAGRIPAGLGITLRMTRGDAPAEAVVLGTGTGGVPVELDCGRMTRLLFGPESATAIPGVPSGLAWLDAVFPLPFHLPELFQA